MREQLIKFLEENYGSSERFLNQRLKVDECPFSNDEMELEDVKIVGDDECFDGNEFYQYVLCGDKLYKAYFELAKDDDGEDLDLDMIDYGHAYRIEDITDTIIDLP